MKRSTIIAMALFVILLVAVVLINDRPVQRGAESMSFVDTDFEAADSIVVEQAESRIDLTRQDGVWRLANGRLADDDAIDRAFSTVSEIDTSEVVSTSEARQTAYGVDPDTGTTVEIGAGSRDLARFVVGTAEDGGAFLREVGQSVIFEAPSTLLRLFPSEEKRWIKMKLVGGELDQVTRVEIQPLGAQDYAIVPGDDEGEWKLDDPSIVPESFRFDPTLARSLANSAVTARAREIVEEAPETTGLEGEHSVLKIHTGDGLVTVHLGQALENGDVYARVEGRDALFLVPAYTAKNLVKSVEQLRDTRLMAFDPEMVNTLQLTSGGQTIAFMKNSDGVWEIRPESGEPPEEFEYDPTSVPRLLSSMTNLRATAIADGVTPKAAGLTRPETRVEVGMSDGQVVALEFGSTLDGEDGRPEVFARGNADDRIYRAGTFHRDRFARGWENFEVIEPPPNMGGNPFGNLTPEQLKNLPPEVRESLMKQMLEQQQKQKLMQSLQQQ